MQLVENIPELSTDQMVEVDRLMIEEYQISLVQMMENAGRNLAELARQKLGGRVAGQRIPVLSGAGNNGGGGLVAARHLHNWGAKISLVLAHNPEHLKDVPACQWRILGTMGLKRDRRIDLREADLIIDALIGYGLRGDPFQPVAGWIERANSSGTPILALDAPSGLDTTEGTPGDPCIRAAATLTLALPKSGLQSEGAAEYVGELYLADISVPAELYKHMGVKVPNIFEELGKKGVKNVVLVTAGFREVDNAEGEIKMKELAAQYDIRYMGPNCLGYINNNLEMSDNKEENCMLNFTWVTYNLEPGNVSIASQSGTFAAHTNFLLSERDLKLNKALSLGNEGDIDICDALEYFDSDPYTDVILLYIEEIKRYEKEVLLRRI